MLLHLLGLALAVVSAQAPTPPAQQPVFRAGVDLLTVDATVIDREGRQVKDLMPQEFIIEVDGDPRTVVSADYVKLVDDTPRPVGARRVVAPPADETFFSTNNRTITPGRMILLMVDQGNIGTGRGRLVMRSAATFVDGLAPEDRVGMVAIPQGALVDFTTDHEKVREGLLATIGLASPHKGRFHISLSEAIVTAEHSDASLRAQLMERECGGALLSPTEAARCELEVEDEAREIVRHQRQQTQHSLRAMREVLRSLGAVDGPKSVILISEGLVLEGLGGEVDDIAAVAGDARASLDVLLLDAPAVDVTERQRPSTPRQDRDRQLQGLETLAGLSRGALHRVQGAGENAFLRVMRSIAGHYLIAVEARPGDRDGKRHRISVKSNRRAVTVHSRRGFLTPTAPAATTPADAVGKALRAPLTLNELPMRMATWTYKEPGSARVRVLVTAEVERTAEQSLDYTAGIIIVDRNNRVIVNSVAPRQLLSSESDRGLAVYAGSAVLEPGSYLLRFAVADSEGRIGSVERKIDAWQMNTAGLTVGDLLVAQARSDPGAPVVATIEPHVANGRLSAMMEVYAQNLQVDSLQATLEILPSETAKPLTSTPMRIIAGQSPEVGTLQAAMNTAALPPGRHFARAMVTQAGKPQGHIIRPFRVEPSSARTDTDANFGIPSSLPGELLAAMLTNLPGVDRKELLAPAVMGAVLTAAERARPAAKGALASARAGNIGPAALEALAAGDQAMAAFLRGVDFFAQGNIDRAIQQLQVAMQQAPTFAPTRLYLGAALAQANKHREAASLLQSVPADVAGTAPVGRMSGLSWLRAGQATNAIAVLETAVAGPTDVTTGRTLALAYVIADRPADALPLLARSLETNPKDQEALLAAIYATYAVHLHAPRADTLVTDRTRMQTWARTYAGLKGTHIALVDAWLNYLQSAK
ncbi:MAG TPA: VWA domain-containing protein [Vicinamibacterales bacterium]|nr:VWA domain-containing protein [Vicinamibacterales bacterium]